jgi:hypothetical protein
MNGSNRSQPARFQDATRAQSPCFSDRSVGCETLPAARRETLAPAIRKERLHHDLDDI